MNKLIFVTGGVVSSLGKGIAAASLGAWFEGAGQRVRFVKLDPYINLDSGTMSPYQHGEVFVTYDGAETKFYINDVTVSKLSDRAKKLSIGNLKIGFIDFDVHQHRFPRL